MQRAETPGAHSPNPAQPSLGRRSCRPARRARPPPLPPPPPPPADRTETGCLPARMLERSSHRLLVYLHAGAFSRQGLSSQPRNALECRQGNHARHRCRRSIQRRQAACLRARRSRGALMHDRLPANMHAVLVCRRVAFSSKLGMLRDPARGVSRSAAAQQPAVPKAVATACRLQHHEQRFISSS